MSGEMVIKDPVTGESLILLRRDWDEYIKWKKNKEALFDPLAIPINKKQAK